MTMVRCFLVSLVGIALFSPIVAQTCDVYGTPASAGSTCLCPAGFNAQGGSGNCSDPVCGGSLYNPAQGAPLSSTGLGNVSAGSCGCSDGWTGPGCSVCQTATACSSSLSKYLNSSNSLTSGSLNSTLVCSNTPTVYSVSQLACNVVQSSLNSLFPGSSTLTFQLNLNSSRVPGGSDTIRQAGLVNTDGALWAQMWHGGVEQFSCRATGCGQTINAGSGGVNGSVWSCPTLNCTCHPGAEFCGGGTLSASQNLTGPINGLSGPLEIDCMPGGTCYFKQAFLNQLSAGGLPLTDCTFGECVAQYVIDQAEGIVGSTAGASNDLSGGVIAGLVVVGAILLGIIGIVIFGLWRRHQARKVMLADGVLPKGGGVAVNWSGIGYEVKSSSRPWARTVAWLKGSGVEHPDNQEAGSAVGPNGGKIILREACGQLPAGAFCCILGPSGAGKSTLIDILAGKHKTGSVEGKVAYRRDNDAGRVKIGYVDQSDVLAPTSTVLETLLFAAKLRLPENVPLSVKEERAHLVLSQLGLTDVAHTRVGSTEHRGISGGEMRRVSIAVELVAAPDVLVLDEPTSGLDSVSAARLVKLLKNLAESSESRTTIIASIHQPSSALYQSFNQVVLLANGRQLYFGPGRARPAEFFAQQGRPCPQGYNIADHLLEIASGPTTGLLTGPAAVISTSETSSEVSKSSRAPTIENLESPSAEKNALYSPAGPAVLNQDQRAEVDLSALGNDGQKQKREWYPRTHCATTFLTQIEVLSGREWRNLKRDKTLLIAHVFLACVLGVFAGGLYYKVGLTIAGFQNRVGSLFFLGSLIAFSSLSALYNLVEVRGLFLRERAGSYYSPQAWLLSRVLFDVIPLRLFPTIVVSIIVYFMVGLSRHADRFFKYLLILVEFSAATTLFNFLLACVFAQGGVAILISSLCNLFLMTYAGFFVNISQIPPVLRWLRYFSTLGYTLEALSINEVGSGLQIIDTLDGVPIEISATLIMQTLFGFNLGHYYRDVLVLFAFIAGFAVLLVMAVVFVLRERR